MDPRKTIRRPGVEEQISARATAHQVLLAATITACDELKCSGISFIIMGTNLWLMELAELDPRATIKMLDAMSVLIDPKASDTKKEWAEKKRKAAVDKLFAAADLMTSQAEGKA